jgi:hypothetical protein
MSEAESIVPEHCGAQHARPHRLHQLRRRATLPRQRWEMQQSRAWQHAEAAPFEYQPAWPAAVRPGLSLRSLKRMRTVPWAWPRRHRLAGARRGAFRQQQARKTETPRSRVVPRRRLSVQRVRTTGEGGRGNVCVCVCMCVCVCGDQRAMIQIAKVVENMRLKRTGKQSNAWARQLTRPPPSLPTPTHTDTHRHTYLCRARGSPS